MGAATIPFETDVNATLNGTLTGIDAALAARAAAPEAELLPSALADGRFDFQGALSETRTWSGTMRLHLAARPNARGRVSVGGDLALTLRDGRWTVTGDSRLAGVAPASVTASGDARRQHGRRQPQARRYGHSVAPRGFANGGYRGHTR